MHWTKQLDPSSLPIRSWCADVEPGALVQAENLSRHPALFSHVALMPDCHQGYGMPIGGVVAADAAVIPAAVGVDITLTPEQCDAALDGIVYERWHPYRKFGKAKGRLDLSEAPQAYKDIEDVIRSERDLVEPLVRLVPMSSLKG